MTLSLLLPSQKRVLLCLFTLLVHLSHQPCLRKSILYAIQVRERNANRSLFSTSIHPTTSLCDLPNELLQRICDSFRLYQRESLPHSWLHLPMPITADDIRNRKTLHSLCLVSRRIAAVAVVELYSSITSPIEVDTADGGIYGTGLGDVPYPERRRTARLKETRALSIQHIRSPEDAQLYGSILSSCPGLQVLTVRCSEIDTAFADTLRRAIPKLMNLQYVVLHCEHSEPLVAARLLSSLAGSHVYEGLKIMSPPC